jgi:twinkle protein
MQEQNQETRKHYLNFINAQRGIGIGQHKIACPECQHKRKKNKKDKAFSVNIDAEKIIYNCFHCGINGVLNRQEGVFMQAPVKPQKKIVVQKNQTKGAVVDWLKERGIDQEIAIRSGCLLTTKNNKPVLGFSFNNGDGVEAVKWRSANGSKEFWWENNAKRLWGEQVKDKDLPDIEETIVITEGEMDMLSIKQSFMGEANIEVYSVPNGAPSKVSVSDGKIDPKEDGRFSYVWNDRSKFDDKRIILAVDNDESGRALGDELARRLNKAKCCIVDYGNYKDANDMLLGDGASKLRDAVLYAEPIPLHGLNNVSYYKEEIQSLYDKGVSSGWSTGLASVDELFTIKSGLFVISGHPSEGKSCFVDWLVYSLAKDYGIKTCYCSFENSPSLHSIKLSQIITSKKFWGDNRMTQEEKDYAENFISEHILFQDFQSEGATIDDILERFEQSIMRQGTRICVIDPYNFIRTDNVKGKLMTDVVSDLLSKVQNFCRKNDVTCLFVVHPSKPKMDNKKSIVGGLDISGSYSWFAKSDVGITIARQDGDGVGVHVWKARHGIYGHKMGSTSLTFDPETGRYTDYHETTRKRLQEEIDNGEWDI